MSDNWSGITEFIEEGVKGGYVEVGQPVPVGEVQQELAGMQLVVPPSYVEFVSKYGWLEYDTKILAGVGRRSLKALHTRVQDEAWPGIEGYSIFGTDDINPYGFSGNGVVWVWDHDFGKGEIAPDFLSFLRSEVFPL